MLSPYARKFVNLVIGLLVIVAPLRAQKTAQSEREAMYYRYLEFASYVKGGNVEPHWMADGSSFWYAEGALENTVIWKVDPTKGGTKTPLFDTARLRQALAPLLGHKPPYQGLPFEEFSFLDDSDRAVKLHRGGQGVCSPARHLHDFPGSYPVRGRAKSNGSPDHAQSRLRLARDRRHGGAFARRPLVCWHQESQRMAALHL